MRASDTRRGILAAVLLAAPGCYSGVGTGGDDDAPGADGIDDGADAGDEGGSDDVDGPEPQEPEEECVDTRTYFEEEVWRPVLSRGLLRLPQSRRRRQGH